MEYLPNQENLPSYLIPKPLNPKSIPFFERVRNRKPLTDQKKQCSFSPLQEYSQEICQNLLISDNNNRLDSTYINNQPDVNHRTRSILVDWIVATHNKLKLSHQTLFITISIIDRYLQKKAIQLNQLQLVGISSLLIAAKYQEIYPPAFKYFLVIGENAYNKTQILGMESDILSTIEFRISPPTPLCFLEHYEEQLNLGNTEKQLARYLTELVLLDCTMIKYNASLIAACAVYLSKKFLKQESPNQALLSLGYQIANIKETAKQMIKQYLAANQNCLRSSFNKYSTEKHGFISSLKLTIF